MSLLITLLVWALVFALLWFFIGIIPLPAPFASAKWVLYAILILVAVVELLQLVGVGSL